MIHVYISSPIEKQFQQRLQIHSKVISAAIHLCIFPIDIFMRHKLSLAMAYECMHLILFLFVFPLCGSAENNGLVNIGDSLTAGETSSQWLSPSGIFAFGFRPVEGTDLFLLSIWYDKIPDKTVVWYNNSINPVPRGSTVGLDAQTGLVLRNPRALSLWISEGITGQVRHANMSDTGNFILVGTDYRWLWESFRFAADTILPLQELVNGSILVSRQSEANFSRGRFKLLFNESGDLVLTSRSVPSNIDDDVVYYRSQTSDPTNTTNSAHRIRFDRSGTISILTRNNQTKQLGNSLPPESENYYRATLDFDGVFTHYYHPKTSTSASNLSWRTLWTMPDNICFSTEADMGSGACGFNNICSLKNRRPVCKCPEGYTLLDPNDKYGTCTPNSTLSCTEVEVGSAEDLYDFVVLNNTDWPKSDYERISPSDEAECRQACLQDCLCAVSIFRDSSCWKKKLPLSNGKVDRNLNSRAFIKYRKSDIPPPQHPVLPPVPAKLKPKDRESLVLVGSVLLGSSLFVNFLFIGAACLGFYLIYQKKKVIIHPRNVAVDVKLHCFSYKELEDATNGFKEVLGRGSYGIVYKGETEMSSRKTTIAVKKLHRFAEDAEREFRAEVNTIGQTNHKNLVRLLGFCDEGQHRLLVYEYMSRGTLSNFLFCNPKPDWNIRTQIAIGIAKGLVYLHEECSAQIIHCDIKLQNILLDDYYNARISDFGLAKLLVINQSRTLTDIRGTKGYVAPEWYRNTQITAKVDVYSFGVLLLEIISCRRCVDDVEIGIRENAILTDWAWDCFQQRKLDSLAENDFEALEDKVKRERFVMVGIWCIQEDPSRRPTMRKVSQMLEGIVEVMVPPCPFPFSSLS